MMGLSATESALFPVPVAPIRCARESKNDQFAPPRRRCPRTGSRPEPPCAAERHCEVAMTSMRRALELHRGSYARNPFGARVALVMALDLGCVVIAAIAARWWADTAVSNETFLDATGVLAIGTFLVLQATGGYDLVTIRSGARTRISLLLSLGIGFTVALVFYYVVPLPESKEALFHAAAVFLPLFLVERKAFRFLSKLMRNRIVL